LVGVQARRAGCSHGRSWGGRGAGGRRVLARDARGRVAKLTSRQTLVIVHDVAATAVATVMSFWLRFDTPGLEERLDALWWFLPGFLLYAAGVYRLVFLFRGQWGVCTACALFYIFSRVAVVCVWLVP